MAAHVSLETFNPPFTNKASAISTVKEIKSEQVICVLPVTEPYIELDDRIICALPPAPKLPELEKAKLLKEFECEYPSTEPNVNRVTYPLPFPNELEEVIGWADAFVDRVASLTAARKSQTTNDMGRLATELKRLDNLLATTQVALDKSREDTEKAKGETRCVREELNKSKAETKARDEAIACLKADLAKAGETEKLLRDQVKKVQLDLLGMTKDRDDALEAFKKADAHAAAEHKKAAAEHKKAAAEHKKHKKAEALHEQDHRALEEEHKLLDAECKARKAAEAKFNEARSDLAALQIKYEAKKVVITGLEQRLASLHTKLDEKVKENSKFKGKIELQEKTIAAGEHALKEAKKVIATLTTESIAAKARICQLDADLKKSQAEVDSLKQQLSKTTEEKKKSDETAKKLQNDLDAAKKDVEEKKRELEKARCETESTNTKLKESNARVVGLEERIKKLVAESDNLRSERDVANTKVNDLKERIAKLEAARDNMRSERDKAQNKEEELTCKLDELEKTLKEERRSQKIELDGYDFADKLKPEEAKKLRELEPKAKALTDKLAAAEKLIIQIPTGKKLNILSVEYGGQAYTPGSKQTVIDQLYKHAAEGTEFTINNTLFGGDPLHGKDKTFSITYLLEGENVVHHLYGLEKKKVKFCLPDRK